MCMHVRVQMWGAACICTCMCGVHGACCVHMCAGVGGVYVHVYVCDCMRILRAKVTKFQILQYVTLKCQNVNQQMEIRKEFIC